MSGDQRRDRQKSEARSRASSTSERRVIVPGSRADEHGDFDAPTRRHGRTLRESEAPVSRIAIDPITGTQDSIRPVRVPVRSARPPMSLWKLTWATVALVIVVAGGAIGIVASLRARTTMPGAPLDSSHPVAAAPQGAEPGKATPVAGKSMAAAMPGQTAIAPSAPPQAARNVVPLPSSAVSVSVIAAPSATLAASADSARAANAGAFRTPESLTVSPPLVPPALSASSLARRAKTPETAAAPSTAGAPSNEAERPATPAPAASGSSETTNDSEAWVTEERRF